MKNIFAFPDISHNLQLYSQTAAKLLLKYRCLHKYNLTPSSSRHRQHNQCYSTSKHHAAHRWGDNINMRGRHHTRSSCFRRAILPIVKTNMQMPNYERET